MELSVNIVTNISSLLLKNNYSLYDAYLELEGDNLYLRVLIQNESNSISLEDCIKTNELITSYLDENDPVEDKYILEISSPGIIKYLRTIELMKTEIGNKVTVYFKKKSKINNEKKLVGILNNVEENVLTIDEYQFSYNEIKKIETYYEF